MTRPNHHHDTLVDIGCWSDDVQHSTPYKTQHAEHHNVKPCKVYEMSTTSWPEAHRRVLFPMENGWEYKPPPPQPMASTSDSSTSSEEAYRMPPPFAMHSMTTEQRVLFEDAFGDSLLPFPAQPRRNVFAEVASGMKDVPGWLKSLRLHKYSTLFQQLTYDQMMALNDMVLVQQGVTKGARRKILASVHKLHDRVRTLTLIQQCRTTLNDDLVRSLIHELKTMLYTPIRAYPLPGKPEPIQARIDGLDIDIECLDRENLPAHLTRALSHVQSWIITREMQLADEHWYALMGMYERVAHHEAFTLAQKRRVAMLKAAGRKQWLATRSTHYPSLIIPTVNGGYQCINVNQPPPSVVLKAHVYATPTIRPMNTHLENPSAITCELQRMVREVCDAFAAQDVVPPPCRRLPPASTSSIIRPDPIPIERASTEQHRFAVHRPSTYAPSPSLPPPTSSCTPPWSDAQWSPHIDTLASSVTQMAIGNDV